MFMISLALALAAPCSVTDGDTIRCGDERIRLTGIDAPETGRCPRNRKCVKGDGEASKRTLERIIAGKHLRIVRLGKDHYGRTLAAVYVDGQNVACPMIRAGQAVYVAKWDDERRVARDCKVR